MDPIIRTKHSIETQYKRALRVQGLKGRKYSFDTSDFPAWYIVKLLENKSQHQTLDQAFIDYLREIHNNPLTKIKDVKIEKAYTLEDTLNESIDKKLLKLKLIKSLKTNKQKELIKLVFQGHSLKECTLILNRSISCISTMIKFIIDQNKKSLLPHASKQTPYNL
jgi:hypothetical protein